MTGELQEQSPFVEEEMRAGEHMEKWRVVLARKNSVDLVMR